LSTKPGKRFGAAVSLTGCTREAAPYPRTRARLLRREGPYEPLRGHSEEDARCAAQALSQALSDGLVPRNAADGVKLPRAAVPGEEIKPLDSEECGAFLEASRGERLEVLYVLAVHCGLREGELLALR
jgi:hypothetical protein